MASSVRSLMPASHTLAKATGSSPARSASSAAATSWRSGREAATPKFSRREWAPPSRVTASSLLPTVSQTAARPSSALGQAALVAQILPDADALAIQVDGRVVVAGLLSETGEIFQRRPGASTVSDPLQLRQGLLVEVVSPGVMPAEPGYVGNCHADVHDRQGVGNVGEALQALLA